VLRNFLLLHGGDPLDELLIAAAGAIFLIGGWIAIRSAPAPEAQDNVSEMTSEDPQEIDRPPAKI
jgi:hypothetical protein